VTISVPHRGQDKVSIRRRYRPAGEAGRTLAGPAVNTARVTSPRTGFAYLDRVLDPPGSVLAFAHRGGAYHPEIEGLENTLAAFRHAVALGYEYLETDVHVTRDGVLLAFHDTVLDRVTDRRGVIAEITHAEVREALVGGRESVPMLADLFDAFPGARFNIDIKSEGAVPVLADFIAAREAWDQVLVGSFSQRRIDRFRVLTAGRVATSATLREIGLFRFLPSGRLAAWLTRDRCAALQVPHRRGRLTVVTPGLVRRAHAAGKHVHVWTIDDAEEMGELLDRGVDGVFTDRTDILKAVLTERNQWRRPWRNEA
jgi:glycerophosphoryl diester phosphodiesterase